MNYTASFASKTILDFIFFGIEWKYKVKKKQEKWKVVLNL